MKRYAISIVAGVLAGLLAMAWARREPPRPRLHDKQWQITDPGGKAIDPGRPLHLPNPRYGDFDLNCRIELPPDADLDLVFRKVEAWDEMLKVPGFHGRFAAVRMSSRKKGPGFLTREQLLFGPDQGGIMFSPGIPGSLELMCRGRTATALVNGVEIGPFSTVDDFGNLALICRQGTALVHDLTVTPWPVPRSDGVWFVGAGVGAALGLLLALCQTPWLRVAFALALFVTGGGLAGLLFDSLRLPLVRPSDLAVIWGASCFGIAAACLVGPRLRLWQLPLTLLLGGGAAVALLEVSAQEMRWGWKGAEDPRLDLTFGPESGLEPFRALARQLRNEYAIQTLDPAKRTDVMLLGPARMFDVEGDPSKNLTAMLPSLLGERLKIPPGKPSPRCVALAADLSCAQQQLWGLDRYYRDYRPKVIVLGLTSDEDDSHELYGGAPRRLAAALEANAPPEGFMLPQLFAESGGRGDIAPQSPAEFRAMLDEYLALSKELDARLVLTLDHGLSDTFKNLAEAFAAAEKIPTVTGFAVDSGVLAPDQLADVVVRALIR